MEKTYQSQTGQESLIDSLKKMGSPITLMNYLSIAGISLPLDPEMAAVIAGDFPEWEKEVYKLVDKSL